MATQGEFGNDHKDVDFVEKPRLNQGVTLYLSINVVNVPVIDTVAQQLAEDPNRKFIYVETAFFARWWQNADADKRATMKKLVKARQLEFINGGWCMHDEASPLWTAMVDQTTRGHQFLKQQFGENANPKGTWLCQNQSETCLFDGFILCAS